MLREACWIAPTLLVVGYAGGLVGWRPVYDPVVVGKTALMLLIAPAFGEEILFRAIPLSLPWGSSDRFKMSVSTVLFVLWHPIQQFTIGPPWASMFSDPWFLLMVAILGWGLARLFMATHNIWPCVILHWIVVMAWKLIFAGPF